MLLVKLLLFYVIAIQGNSELNYGNLPITENSALSVGCIIANSEYVTCENSPEFSVELITWEIK